ELGPSEAKIGLERFEARDFGGRVVCPAKLQRALLRGVVRQTGDIAQGGSALAYKPMLGDDGERAARSLELRPLDLQALPLGVAVGALAFEIGKVLFLFEHRLG